MKLVDHIGIFENAVPDELCDLIIKVFAGWMNEKMTPEVEQWKSSGEDQFPDRGMSRKDEQLYLNHRLLLNDHKISPYQRFVKMSPPMPLPLPSHHNLKSQLYHMQF
jgi:hypothetical protein